MKNKALEKAVEQIEETFTPLRDEIMKILLAMYRIKEMVEAGRHSLHALKKDRYDIERTLNALKYLEEDNKILREKYGDNERRVLDKWQIELRNWCHNMTAQRGSYKTHNDTRLDMSGTCLQGHCPAITSYCDLLVLFGAPHIGDGYKVQAEWCILFADGTRATIYDWKQGASYNGDDYDGNKDPKDLTGSDWHIGGDNVGAADKVRQIIMDYHAASGRRS